MPRTSDKKKALAESEHAAQVIASYIALSRSHGRPLWKNLEVLVHTYAIFITKNALSVLCVRTHRAHRT